MYTYDHPEFPFIFCEMALGGSFICTTVSHKGKIMLLRCYFLPFLFLEGAIFSPSYSYKEMLLLMKIVIFYTSVLQCKMQIDSMIEAKSPPPFRLYMFYDKK